MLTGHKTSPKLSKFTKNRSVYSTKSITTTTSTVATTTTTPIMKTTRIGGGRVGRQRLQRQRRRRRRWQGGGRWWQGWQGELRMTMTLTSTTRIVTIDLLHGRRDDRGAPRILPFNRRVFRYKRTHLPHPVPFVYLLASIEKIQNVKQKTKQKLMQHAILSTGNYWIGNHYGY